MEGREKTNTNEEESGGASEGVPGSDGGEGMGGR